MQYWAHIDGLQRGPMTLDELIGLGITQKTYVWRAGLKDWVQAKDLEELSGYFNIPKGIDESTKSEEKQQNRNESETVDLNEEKSEQQIPSNETSEGNEKQDEPGATSDEKEPVVKDDAITAEGQIPVVEPEKNPEEKEKKESGQTVPPPVPNVYPINQNNNWTPVPACPPTNLVWAIIATVLCCQILGIVAIIYAAQVESKYRMGQYDMAQKYSDRAAIWCMVSFAAGLVYVPVAIILAML